jgi:hypothetical protein
MLTATPALADLQDLSRDLTEAADIGLEAMNGLEGDKPAAGWAKARLGALRKIAAPKAAVELRIIPAIENLVLAAQPMVDPPLFSPEGGLVADGPVAITMQSKTPSAEIRYTLDGSTPTVSSALYTGPVSLEKTTFVNAVAFKKGLEESFMSSATVSIVDRTNGVRCSYFEGEWDSLPRFAAQKPKDGMVVREFGLGALRNRGEHYGLEFSGFIEISTEGEYTFFTSSDDGSRLVIDGTEVVNNDGRHATLEKSGRRWLKPGRHPISVTFFQAAGGQALTVSFEGPGIKKQPIPAGVLFRDRN